MSVARILAHKGRKVTSVGPDATLQEAAGVMSAEGIGAVLVLDGTRALLGVLSERDIVRAVAARGPGVLADEVRFHMTRDVVTCGESDSVNGLMEVMTTRKFRHVPVVDRGRVTGIVSIGDVVKFRLAEIEMEHQALREYIATG
ncbi:CBS domain-containing protein [Camelimonas abortus]|uniref:CBS domain-containing protein n=1 Tax=Camelimonas abortus TaxID=1017184 RepID=A0ABV7LH61_9HYPH